MVKLIVIFKNLFVSFKVAKSLYHLPDAACLPHCAWHNLVLSWFQAQLLISFLDDFRTQQELCTAVRKWCCLRTLGYLMYFGLSFLPGMQGQSQIFLGRSPYCLVCLPRETGPAHDPGGPQMSDQGLQECSVRWLLFSRSGQGNLLSVAVG